MFRKQLDEAQAGDNIGALLRGVNRDQIVRGQVLAKPGTVTCHHKFTAQVYVLTKDEGWTSYSILQQLSSTVLLQNNRRNRYLRASRGNRDVHAW